MHHHRKSIRLRRHDYSSQGAYFITMCTHERVPSFGFIDATGMHLSDIGNCASRRWLDIPSRFMHASLDAFVVMPDHVHGIIVLHELDPIALHSALDSMPSSVQHEFQHVTARSIATIVQSYKAGVTRDCRRRGTEPFRWQRNYYERIIRDSNELAAVRSYIQNNPTRWFAERGSSER